MNLPPKPPPRPPLPPRPHLHVVSSAGQFVLSPRITLNPREITGKSIAILGTNGSGKSSTARQLMEQHIEKGLKQYPFTVCDIENEYATLKELSENIYLAGASSETSDSIKLDIVLSSSAEFFELGRKAFEERLTIVLLIGNLEDDVRKLYLNAYLCGLFEAANDPQKAHYYRVFIEEVQEFCSQLATEKSKDELRSTIIRFAKRGRKRKLSLVLISQRPANVDKNVLTQAHLLLLHFVTYSTDINVYAGKAGYGIEGVAEKVKQMRAGDVIFIFNKIQIEDHVNKPRTSSPWDESGVFDSSHFKTVTGAQEIQNEIIRESQSGDHGTSVVPTGYIHGLERRIPELEGQVRGLVQTQIAHEDEIARLRERISAASPQEAASIESVTAVQSLRDRANRFEAEASIIGIFADLVANRLNGKE